MAEELVRLGRALVTLPSGDLHVRDDERPALSGRRSTLRVQDLQKHREEDQGRALVMTSSPGSRRGGIIWSAGCNPRASSGGAWEAEAGPVVTGGVTGGSCLMRLTLSVMDGERNWSPCDRGGEGMTGPVPDRWKGRVLAGSVEVQWGGRKMVEGGRRWPKKNGRRVMWSPHLSPKKMKKKRKKEYGEEGDGRKKERKDGRAGPRWKEERGEGVKGVREEKEEGKAWSPPFHVCVTVGGRKTAGERGVRRGGFVTWGENGGERGDVMDDIT